MRRLRFITLEFPLDVADVVNATLEGADSLLDADVMLISPSGVAKRFGGYARAAPGGTVGLQLQPTTRMLHDALWSRRREVDRLLNAGKVIFCLLEPHERYPFLSGYAPLDPKSANNYDCLPGDPASTFAPYVEPGSGTRVSWEPRSAMSEYCRAFAKDLQYAAYLTAEVGSPFARVQTTGHVAGTVIARGPGYLVLMPRAHPSPPDPNKLVGVLCACARRLRRDIQAVPPPAYVESQEYQLPGESDQSRAVEAARKAVCAAEVHLEEQRALLGGLARWKGLVYETGDNLQSTVVDALNLLGLNARSQAGKPGEWDIVAEPPGGLLIGEVTSREEAQVQRDEVERLYAKTAEYEIKMERKADQRLLVINAYPAQPPEARPPQVTEDAVAQATTFGVAILASSDLFYAVRGVLCHPEDDSLKRLCRELLLKAKPGIVQLPPADH